MNYKATTESILHQLGIGKSYSGYYYISYAMDLLIQDETELDCITKILYFDVAKQYQTSPACVERNIRKVIDVIWKHKDENQKIIIKIFGIKYASNKPSNKAFLELLYEYARFHHTIEDVLQLEKIICPISKQVCNTCYELIEKIIEF